MEKTKLEMDFLNEGNKIIRFAVDEPNGDLSKIEIEDAMNNIISLNIFDTKEGDLVGISAARIITTNVSDIKF